MMSPESKLHYDSIGRQITMSVPFDSMSVSSKIIILCELMKEFAPPDMDAEAGARYMKACDLVLDEANMHWG